MSWPLQKFSDYQAWADAGRPPGGMWPVTPEQAARRSNQDLEGGWGEPWPDRYRAGILAGAIQAWWIGLPGGGCWCPWQKAFDDKYHGEGWDIQQLEPLTVTPSINAAGSYHGWVTAGVLTDDCEGRRFDQAGRRLP